MLKPLIINRSCYFDNSLGGECLRSFMGAMRTDVWGPVVYASDRRPLVSPIPSYAHMIHEYKSWQYFAAAIRRVLPDLTFLPGYEWQSWGIKATSQILRDIKNGQVKPDYIHSISLPFNACVN